MKRILVALISLFAVDSLCTKLTAPEYIGSITGATATALLIGGNSIHVLLASITVGLAILFSMILLKATLKRIEQMQGLKSSV